MSLGCALGLSIPAASSVTETAVPVKRFTRRREGGTSAARRLPPSRPAPPCRPPHGADRSAHDRYGTPRRDRMSRRLPDGNDQGSDWRATTARWSSSMRLRSSQQAWANPDVMALAQRCGGETPKWRESVRFRLIREWRKCTCASTMSGFALMQCIPAVGKQRPSASIGVFRLVRMPSITSTASPLLYGSAAGGAGRWSRSMRVRRAGPTHWSGAVA